MDDLSVLSSELRVEREKIYPFHVIPLLSLSI